jgi:hypothetical protein
MSRECRLLAKRGSAQLCGFATGVGSKTDIGAPSTSLGRSRFLFHANGSNDISVPWY